MGKEEKMVRLNEHAGCGTSNEKRENQSSKFSCVNNLNGIIHNCKEPCDKKKVGK